MVVTASEEALEISLLRKVVVPIAFQDAQIRLVCAGRCAGCVPLKVQWHSINLLSIYAPRSLMV
jgi:hypothetical protein